MLREQGVNGQVEMAAAFDRAGFDAIDVHMSDLIAGRVSLADFAGFVACGGFSYGDVLGGGEGWAKSILFNPRARDEFAAFFARPDSFALGVCNGCQMMSALDELIPGAELAALRRRTAPSSSRRGSCSSRSRRARRSSSTGMAGSRIPVVTAHGEGRALFARGQDRRTRSVPMRFVDNLGAPTELYPSTRTAPRAASPASRRADGRFTIVMPHPERVFRTVQMSWHPDEWGEDSPWMRLFRNARAASAERPAFRRRASRG